MMTQGQSCDGYSPSPQNVASFVEVELAVRDWARRDKAAVALAARRQPPDGLPAVAFATCVVLQPAGTHFLSLAWRTPGSGGSRSR